jgi:hypothetical protein
VSLTLFLVTHVSIRTSHTSSGPRGSAFAGLENAPLPLGCQIAGVRCQEGLRGAQFRGQAVQHARDLSELFGKPLVVLGTEVPEIPREATPQNCFICAAECDQHETTELGARSLLPRPPFSEVGTDRLGRSSQLTCEFELLVFGKSKRELVRLQSSCIRFLEDLHIPNRRSCFAAAGLQFIPY